MPSISVIMTTYNSATFIREAVDSILNQTFSDFEFVIVDDGSTDDTFEILKSYHDQRIKLFRNQHNLGQTKSLNIAIRKSSGTLLARMDGDDIAYPNRFQLQVEFLNEHPEISVVGGWVHYINQTGNIFRLFKTPTDPTALKTYLSASGDLSYWCIVHPTVMIRKNIFDCEGLYNEEKGAVRGYPQDYELWSRIFDRYQFGNIPQPLLKYRVLNTSDSRQFDQMQYRLEISAQKIKRFLPNLQEREIKSLTYMLEFLPQPSKQDGSVVLTLFKKYFENIFLDESNDKIRTLELELIAYYLPVLSRTNFNLAVKEWFKCLLVMPMVFFNFKFYRKLIKGVWNG